MWHAVQLFRTSIISFEPSSPKSHLSMVGICCILCVKIFYSFSLYSNSFHKNNTSFLGGSYSEIQDPDSMTQTPILGNEGIKTALWSFHCYSPQTSKESPQWLSVSMAHILGLDAAEQVVIIKLFLTAPLQYGFLRVPALSF